MVSWQLKREPSRGSALEATRPRALEKVTYAPALSWLTDFLFGEPQDVPAGQTPLEVSRSNVHRKHLFARGDIQVRLVSATNGLVLPPDSLHTAHLRKWTAQLQ